MKENCCTGELFSFLLRCMIADGLNFEGLDCDREGWEVERMVWWAWLYCDASTIEKLVRAKTHRNWFLLLLLLWFTWRVGILSLRLYSAALFPFLHPVSCHCWRAHMYSATLQAVAVHLSGPETRRDNNKGTWKWEKEKGAISS